MIALNQLIILLFFSSFYIYIIYWLYFKIKTNIISFNEGIIITLIVIILVNIITINVIN